MELGVVPATSRLMGALTDAAASIPATPARCCTTPGAVSATGDRSIRGVAPAPIVRAVMVVAGRAGRRGVPWLQVWPVQSGSASVSGTTNISRW